MRDKNWYESKTVWSAMAVLLLSVYTAYTGQPIPVWVWGILGSLGLYGVRDAIGNISKRR